MRASQRKYHYIYKITRFDGMFYIGLHSTDNLDDGYFGSGQRLWYSVKKYGKDKHVKEILEFLPDRKTLCDRERQLVNHDLLTDDMCMNLRLGRSYEYRKPDHEESARRKSEGLRAFYADPEKSAAARQKISEAHTGRKASPETIVNMQSAAKERMARMRADGSWEAVKEKNRQKHLGKKQTPETIAKKNASMKAFKEANGGKRTFSDQARVNIGNAQRGTAKNAQEWKLTALDGTEQVIKNLSSWLKETKLVTNRDKSGIREPAKPGVVKPILYYLERIS